jgi:hypothetical protein
MIAICVLCDCFKSRQRLEAEIRSGMTEFGKPIATILFTGQDVQAYPPQEPTWRWRPAQRS